MLQNQDSLSINKIETLVKLAQFNAEVLMSRCQAKRIVLNLDKFEHVILDFSGIRLVGQGFVDQLFRVFQNAHPHIRIEYIHANEDVKFMIQRGIKRS